MPEWYVSGTYGDTVVVGLEVGAVDRALDKGGWSWEASLVGEPLPDIDLTKELGAIGGLMGAALAALRDEHEGGLRDAVIEARERLDVVHTLVTKW